MSAVGLDRRVATRPRAAINASGYRHLSPSTLSVMR